MIDAKGAQPPHPRKKRTVSHAVGVSLEYLFSPVARSAARAASRNAAGAGGVAGRLKHARLEGVGPALHRQQPPLRVPRAPLRIDALWGLGREAEEALRGRKGKKESEDAVDGSK